MSNPGDQQKERLTTIGQAALNMSHGIKNISQSIRSGQDVMDEALNRNNIDVARRTWIILKQNIDRIQKLSLDMLKFSKAEPPRIQPCDLNWLVKSVVGMLGPQADQRHITITSQIDRHLETIPADPEQMRDVILNLLINALEAVPDQTGTVTIQTELDQPNQQAILRITDNGSGIENPDVIFDPFYSTKSNIGAGLGLTITQNIVTNHGGTINAHPLTDQGSVFTVCIPLEPQKQ